MGDNNFSVAELTKKFSDLCQQPVGLQYKGKTLLSDGDVKSALDDCYSNKKLFLEVDLIAGSGTATQQAVQQQKPTPTASSPPPKAAPASSSVKPINTAAAATKKDEGERVAPGVDQTAAQLLSKYGLSSPGREPPAAAPKAESPRRVQPKQESPRRVQTIPQSSSSPRRAAGSLQGGVDGELRDAINQLRTKPTSFVSMLEERKSCYDGNTLRLKRGKVTFRSQTHEGPTAVTDAISLLRSASPVSEVKFCAGLSDAARDIIAFMGPNGDRRPSPDDMAALIEKHGQYEGTLSQVIAYIYEDDVNATIQDLIVCDGDSSRHTAGLLLNPEYKFGGLAVSQPDKGPRLVVLQFVSEDWQDN